MDQSYAIIEWFERNLAGAEEIKLDSRRDGGYNRIADNERGVPITTTQQR